ncbi:MAG: methyltransferase domain-containing protein [Gammaproteobacteria bacterium]|nr:class I SAM-dependent methyltransferase [Gammaproteobacteria bacterium]NIP89825.1 class I SAM-dependent methyltransferase [Gammaproteobacteria bacterium]NIR22333.1 class I SAM-dependent methyltransferase [Gammaproteobacteria bacterium]NIS06338.1 class I SAM-dependent methyltransferase [Gammaproteobacteria bacterium]NIV45983.1 methyltransferase domain-containing protein [Gammaproteobacteria bacterium]
MDNVSSEYCYASSEPTWSNHYLWPPVREILLSHLKPDATIMDLGCGSGATAAMLVEQGYSVTGVDPSATGICIAEKAYPEIRFAERSAYDDLASEFGEFDAVVSLEVVEHCYWPRKFANNVFALLRPGGLAVISTPFHGYWKNLALALTGKFDAHWSPLWDGGHIKFWSERTLRVLLEEAGFQEIKFRRIGRISALAKSMIAISRKAE